MNRNAEPKRTYQPPTAGHGILSLAAAIALAFPIPALAATFGATSFNAESHPTDNNRIRDMGSKIGYIRDKTWVRYDATDLGNGLNRIEVTAASDGAGGTLEIRVDAPDGPIIGSVDIPSTGGWNSFDTFNITDPISSVGGIRDLYLVFTNPSASLYLFDVGRITLTLAATDANDPPQPSGNRFETVANEPILLDVLANDSDPDGDDLTLVGFTDRNGSLSGTIEQIGDRFLYTPPTSDFSGPDVFDYSITDGTHIVDEIVVFIDVRRYSDPVFTANAGGAEAFGGNGVLLSPDNSFDGGFTFSTQQTIAGATQQVQYQTERYGRDFGYNIALPDQPYTVVLKFAEIFFSEPNRRIFDVLVEGSEVLTDLDLAAEAGPFTAYEQVIHVEGVNDATNPDDLDRLTIDFLADLNNGKISAIQVSPKLDIGNEKPSVSGDSFFIGSSGEPVMLDVLANDTDLDGPDALRLVALGDRLGSTQGSVEVIDNQVRYTPPGPSFGVDVFSYSVFDGLHLQQDIVVFVYE